ncbi:MAG: hypothetical protein AB7P34_12700, partial [Vicinamibacterales bacterium]
MSVLQPISRAAALVSFVVLGALTSLGAGISIPLLSQTAASTGRVRPITDPTQLRRLEFDDLEYTGAFRLPATDSNGDNFSSGGGPLAFNPARSSLFVGARSGRVAEISIPAAVVKGSIADLPAAEYLQPFADPAEGRMKEVAEDGAALAGLLVHGGRLYGTGVIYYDANHTQSVSHFSRPLTLAERGATAMRRVGARGRAGLVAGYLASVPPEWQTALGGPALTGQCCIPIVGRTSWGPAAFAWDPAGMHRDGDIDASPLVYYTAEHPTLGPWDGSNPTYGGTIQMGGLAVIAGTRTALFVGRNGLGPFCYGNGTGDERQANRTGGDGERYCYDPSNSDKGQHAYPYRYQMWAYDLAEWAAVRAGRRDPWSVKPYGVWPFDLPFPEAGVRVGGVAYDAAGRRLFVSQLHADRDGFAYRA